jgi:hypothetical protein
MMKDLNLSDSDRVFPNVQDVAANMRKTGYPDRRVHLIKGPVEETLPRNELGEIAILRLDTDWYSSTRCELEYLFPKLSTGGVLIIDDYGHFEGAKKATDEFFAAHPTPILLNRIDYAARIGVKIA